MRRRSIAMACIIALFLTSAATTGCFGRNALWLKVRGWNAEVVDSKWGRQFIWLGLQITTVYAVTSILDKFVFNVIEFWSGKNPLTGEVAITVAQGAELLEGPDGSQIASQILSDGSARVEIRAADGSVEILSVALEDERMIARDETGRRVGVVDESGWLRFDAEPEHLRPNADG